LQANFSTQRKSDTDLERRKIVASSFLAGFAEKFSGKAAEGLPNSYGAGGPILFRQSHKQSAAQPRSSIAVSLSFDEQVEDTGEVLKNLVGMGWS